MTFRKPLTIAIHYAMCVLRKLEFIFLWVWTISRDHSRIEWSSRYPYLSSVFELWTWSWWLFRSFLRSFNSRGDQWDEHGSSSHDDPSCPRHDPCCCSKVREDPLTVVEITRMSTDHPLLAILTVSVMIRDVVQEFHEILSQLCLAFGMNTDHRHEKIHLDIWELSLLDTLHAEFFCL